MPWSTPTLADTRSLVRDSVRATLPGSDATIPNSVLRVMSDTQGGLCHLTLQYIDWLALQLLPDTAETEWLDRHGNIWLVNADGTTGRKQATPSSGTILITGQGGTIVPAATQWTNGTQFVSGEIIFETTADVTLDPNTPTPATVVAVEPGADTNLIEGTPLALADTVPGVDLIAYASDDFYGGTDTETDDELRARVLRRIRQPPMGGCAYDYEAWALAVPGVTRAWAVGMEMGVGTASVRFMMDDLRASNDGFPLPQDIAAVQAYIDSKRPVTVKECWVLAPLKQPIDFAIVNLNPDTPATRGAIQASIQSMLFNLAAPGQTIYAAWKYTAVMLAAGVISFDMTTQEDDVMPDVGHMAVLGDIYYSTTPAPTVAQIQSQQKLIAPPHGRPSRSPNG